MEPGIYERLVTQTLRSDLTAVDAQHQTAKVDPADLAHVLARHVGDKVLHTLASAKPSDRVSIANRILRAIDSPADSAVDPAEQLTRVFIEPALGVLDRTAIRPETPLSEVALLTNAGNGEPSIGHELPAEIASADRVDLVCAFIRWSGVRLLERELEQLAEADKPFRIITTTYLGSTEREALDRMVRRFGAQVRVQYDPLRTRLHAKAWMFHRDSGYDTAYIGSSNLSNAALIDGVEWNVRLSRIATPSLLDRFSSTFNTYWNDDPAFEEYLPDVHRDRLDDALRASATGGGTADRATLSLSNLDVRPYPYQQAMLEQLWAERSVHNRTKNLIVAATGTGKTVLAALDYQHLAEASKLPPRLLFVAHRKEILQQSLRTFREVLGDANFGETWVDGARPGRWNHVFASVQSITAYGVNKIPADHFDIVVIDEFHHAEAATYRKILAYLQPRELVGLTATPERADGVDVRVFFDGRIASELRLWDALGAQILCPFHYFGIADGTDLSSVTWSRGSYDAAQLEKLYTGDDARVRIVLTAIADKIVSPSSMRALGFCVSVAHAEYMAERFNAAGIRAVAVHGHTNPATRATAIADLRTRSVNVIFSVDVFNEGLDIPDVDTILMLRPTESATVFLQQLGRGLRSRPDKPVLTVLDFVGVQRDEFRWDRRIRSMTGLSRGKIIAAAKNRFPYLPAGCRIVLDEQTQASVISNLKNQLAMRWPDMVSELRTIGDVPLSEYLDDTGLTLVDILKSGKNRGSWAKLRRDAGLISSTPSEIETDTLKRIKAFAHVDDALRAHTYRALLTTSGLSYDTLDDQTRLLARMMHFSVWPNGGGHVTFDAGLQALRTDMAIQRDILDVVDVAFGEARHEAHPLEGSLSHLPLRVHARYSREEALAGLDVASFDFKPSSFVEGVKYVKHLNSDALFISLQKTEKSFSPSTMYRDYPISRSLIHWESQNRTSLSSPAGQRYANGTSTILIFIRHTTSNELGPNPYTFLGPATLVSHEGERPISAIWRLHREMPAEFFNEAKVAAG
ncbi:DUF3427 domain-containing protein [Gordonia malaquae]|uniref:DUF3427 domain-containing protein n=1 Tax=Gordonia malaquae TaxID=410332 RepID=UPI0030FE1EE5